MVNCPRLSLLCGELSGVKLSDYELVVNCPRSSLLGGELSGAKLSDDNYPVVDCPMVN